ncbi:MAG: hypothetical protein IJ892_04795, partial [Prevotella sp.]|nr:hypothetical protein [Prevotella sp.]
AAAAANHVPARCQPKKHAPFPSAVPPPPCLSCAASPECTPFRSPSTMLNGMSSIFRTVEKTVKASGIFKKRYCLFNRTHFFADKHFHLRHLFS